MRLAHGMLALGLWMTACGGARQTPAAEEPAMSSNSAIQGTWVYAEDPAGELATEAVYQDSILHFGEDGSYRYTMGQITLEGTYEVVQAGDTVKVAIHLSSGGEMTAALTPRDSGIVIVEGDGTMPGQFYAPKPE